MFSVALMGGPVRLDDQTSVSDYEQAVQTVALCGEVAEHAAEDIRVDALLLGSRYAGRRVARDTRRSSRAFQISPVRRARGPEKTQNGEDQPCEQQESQGWSTGHKSCILSFRDRALHRHSMWSAGGGGCGVALYYTPSAPGSAANRLAARAAG